MARVKAKVPALAKADNIRVWAKGNTVISVTSTPCFQGYNLEFWVSKNKALIARIALIGGFTVSVNARNLEASLDYGSKMFEKIIELVSMGREEVVFANVTEELKGIVGLAHIKAHRQVELAPDKKMQTIMEVDFLTKELGYKTAPLLALANMDSISISKMRNKVIMARQY